MVLAHFGHVRSEDECGTPARALLHLASLGFDVHLRFAHLAELGTVLATGVPPIAFVNTGFLDYWSSDCAHVLVVVGVDAATVSVNDPILDSGPQSTSLTGFHAAWAANKCLIATIRPLPSANQVEEESEPSRQERPGAPPVGR